MDDMGQSSQESSSLSFGATLALHVDDSSSGEDDDDEPYRCSLASRTSFQQHLDDLIDEQCQSIQEEMQRQIDKEIHDALEKQIDDAIQKQIDEELQKQIDEELQEQIDKELQKQIDEALNEELGRALDLHNREVSLANQLDLESMPSIYEDESIAKLLQEYFKLDGSRK